MQVRQLENNVFNGTDIIKTVPVNINTLHCQINSNHRVLGERLLRSHLLQPENLKKIFSQVVKELDSGSRINTEKLVLNLGIIRSNRFETEFPQRLAEAFAESLSELLEEVRQRSERLPALSKEVAPEELLAGLKQNSTALYPLALCCLQPPVLQRLLQGRQPQRLQQLLRTLLEAVQSRQGALPEAAYRRVTASRLAMAALHYLLQQQQGRRWLSENLPSLSQLNSWAEAIAMEEVATEQVVRLLTNHQSSAQLITRWLQPLWQRKAVCDLIRRRSDKETIEMIDARLRRQKTQERQEQQREEQPETQERQEQQRKEQPETQERQEQQRKEQPETQEHQEQQRKEQQRKEQPETQEHQEQYCGKQPESQGSRERCKKPHSALVQRVSNAGVLLLWPLLPQLFSLLALTEDQQFTADESRWQAVLSLDYLAWATERPVAERLKLNQLLCGIPPDTELPDIAPLSEEQQQQIDHWFTAIGQQVSAWQKFSLADIRQLYLQRPGEIILETQPPQIAVKHESFDLLLGDWPWPLTLATFPWLEHLLTIIWPVNGLTG